MKKLQRGIMILGIKVAIGSARALYAAIKLFPTRNKVIFISRQGWDVPLDFTLLIDQLHCDQPDLEVKLLCRPVPKGPAIVGYLFHLLTQAYHIATSKTVVLDTYCIPVCIFTHKKTLQVIQIWHALGSFKKFGYAILDKAEARSGGRGLTSFELAQLMHMHENYDLVIASGERSVHNFAQAFNCDPSTVSVISLPRVDLLSDSEKNSEIQGKIRTEHPELGDKKTITFAPTFRRGETVHEEIDHLIEAVDFERYNLIIKVHPLTKLTIEDPRAIQINGYSTLEVLTVSDYLITDYSAITYEMLVLGKPVFFYHLDADGYDEIRGFFTSPSDFPAQQYTDAHALFTAIDNEDFDLKAIHDFTNLEVVHRTGNTVRLAGIIENHCYGLKN
ncbi:MAG: CDP-glycerol glycerophosphotransferase family protein [Propionibacteriaceae bacterium]|nr:CDP-glycerol glycerophosphotransferase family protein [Propionibacteriaceae bacterium]